MSKEPQNTKNAYLMTTEFYLSVLYCYVYVLGKGRFRYLKIQRTLHDNRRLYCVPCTLVGKPVPVPLLVTKSKNYDIHQFYPFFLSSIHNLSCNEKLFKKQKPSQLYHWCLVNGFMSQKSTIF